ncbi:N-acetyl-glucosamine-6-phosphate deacetylase [Xylographa soralifera]|nr:N-acetyl-glucosamine-6-phosphate deacetylase [Xylographa soralifera]
MVSFFQIISFFFASATAIWPLPKVYEPGSSTVWLSRDVQVVFNHIAVETTRLAEPWYDQQRLGPRLFNMLQVAVNYILPNPDHTSARVKIPLSESLIPSEAVLEAAFDRMKSTLFAERFVPFKFHARDIDFEPSVTIARTYVQEIIIENSQISSDSNPHSNTSTEAYSLELREDGSAMIKITSVQGGLHALNTFAQLFYAHTEGEADIFTPYAPVIIEDSPVFAHRGLNLDIARNRISTEDIKRTLDAMSFNKLNRLHLHATDSQSWPLEIPALPELAEKGGYDKKQILSAGDLRDVQAYGQSLGVEVYLEIDLPGHTASIHHSYPELITAYNQQPWEPYAAEPPSGQLKLNSPFVTLFLTILLSDLFPRIAPYSSHFHLGGDELNTNSYTLDPTVNSSSKAVLRPLLQAFYDHVFALAAVHSLTPLAWEEILLDWDLTLPPSTIIQTWRKPASLAAVVARGYRALFGPSTHWYLDCGLGTWMDPYPSKLVEMGTKAPYADWCPPYKNWRLMYDYDPLQGIPEKDRHLVIGGEVHLWGELTDSVGLDGMLWPRVAAAAEVLWRGKGEVKEGVTRRLAEMRERLVARGVGAGMVQMEWCLKNPRGCLH